MIIKLITKILKGEGERASSSDYEVVFNSPEGLRVIEDMISRYNVGKPSFSFDKVGQVNLEASARSDAAKCIITDIVNRSKIKSTASEKPVRAQKETSKLNQLPQAASTI